MFGEFDRVGDGIDDPTEEKFASGPEGVAFVQLGQGDRLFATRTPVSGIQGTEDLVNCVEKR